MKNGPIMTGEAQSLPPELVRAYEQTLFVIDLGSGEEIICEVGKEPSARLPAETVTVITAWNPGLTRPTSKDNRQANRRLEDELRTRGYDYLPARGESRDGNHVEPSFAVFNLSRAEATRLGECFGQAAVFCIGEGPGRLVWCQSLDNQTH